MEKTWLEKYNNFEQCVHDHPDDGEMWLEFAKFLRDESDNTANALLAFQKAQQLLPDLDLTLQIGSALFEDGRDELGIQTLIEYLCVNPSAHGYCLLANNLFRLDDKTGATKYLVMAIALDENFEEIYYLLGEIFRNEFPMIAVAFYRKAIDLDSEYQLAYQSLGSLLASDSKTLDLAISFLEKAVSLNPMDAWGTVHLANAFWRVGRLREADINYKKAIALGGNQNLFNQWYSEFKSSMTTEDGS